jgi:SAM-dependent methyltransferase
MKTPLKLNIGCGNKRIPGFTGVDRFPCKGADYVCDVTKGLPFADDTVDEVLMDNFIEHVLDIPGLMQEVLRVCRDVAVISILTPHFSAHSSWRDPTHVHHLSYFSMDHFQRENVSHYIGKGFNVISRDLSFVGGLMGLMARLLFWMSPERYERKYCFIFSRQYFAFQAAGFQEYGRCFSLNLFLGRVLLSAPTQTGGRVPGVPWPKARRDDKLRRCQNTWCADVHPVE